MNARPRAPSRDADMALIGRIGGFATASRYDPQEYTAPARQGFLQRFFDATPPDLPQAERLRRAEAALRAHMLRLSLASAKARRRRARRGGAP